MFSLRRQNPSRDMRRLSAPQYLIPEQIDMSALENARTFTMPDIGLSIFAHAKDNAALFFKGEAITQYRTTAERPSYEGVLSNDVWVTEFADLNYLAEKKVIVTGPKLTEFDIKSFCRIYPALRMLFYENSKLVTLAELVRIAANYNPRDYFRAFVSVVLLMQMNIKIEAKDGKNQAYLGDRKPLLTLLSKEIRKALAKLLGSEQFTGKNGIQLIEAAKLITLDFQGSALEAMFVVGTPSIEATFTGSEERHICNLMQVIHPDSDLGKEIGLAAIRVYAALSAFTPYLVSVRNEIQSGVDANPGRSKTYPLKTLSLEAIAAIGGRLNMYHDHFGLFVDRVLKPLTRFMGQLLLEGKTNVHVLFDKSLTKMGSKAYAKVKAKFEAFKDRLFCKVALVPKAFSNDLKTEPSASEPKNSGEMVERLKRMVMVASSERAKKELTGLLEFIGLGLDFSLMRNSYRNIVARHGLSP